MSQKGKIMPQWNKIFLIFFAGLMIWLFFHFGYNRYFDMAFLLQKKQDLDSASQGRPALFSLMFFSLYVFCAALSIPGAAILSLAGGMFFDFFTGSLLVSVGGALGATGSFLISRFLLRKWIQSTFHKRLKTVNQGFEKNGALYLFTLRLIPVFPFFVVNWLMGLSPISTKMFFFVSWAGILPATFVYVHAGGRISEVKSLAGIFSPSVVLSFVLLALLPWVIKFFLNRPWRKKQKTS